MNRRQLEHVLRAAGDIADDDELIVIGSQAILGAVPNAPDEMKVSMEIDLYPKNHPERWELIDGSIGEGSPFHATFGYYAQGVDESTAVLPSGWRDRLIAVRNENTRNITGWCLEPHDLVISKLVAGRDKDVRFLRSALTAKIVNLDVLADRLALLEVDEVIRQAVGERIAAVRRGMARG